ncbi:MAG: response regulator [Faecousia sp.]
MNVLIADDDRITREGVIEFVDWDALGLKVIGSAKDGREALQLLSENDVDILVTDIRMPYMSGFELVNATSNKGRFPATIIISGYDDYEYLQQAIKLHIILGYIFKPIQIEQLTQLLKEAITFRREWLEKALVPELTDKDQKRYSYKDVVVNLQNLEAIYLALAKDDLPRAKALFAQSWQTAVTPSGSLNFAKRFAWESIISLMQFLAKDGINAQDIVTGADPLSLVSALDQKQAVYQLLEDFLENIHMYQQERNRYSDPKFAYVRQALESRYPDPGLTLQLLADDLGVTANYLGTLYKKERGESFTTDLMNIRLEHAKQLLTTTPKKVYDIAAEVGFSDSKYFAVAFRKATGLRPSQYRDRFYRKGNDSLPHTGMKERKP